MNSEKTIGLIGRKIGMSQIFDEEDNLIPITIIEAGPCPLIYKKNIHKKGNNLALGFIDKFKKVNKAQKTLFDKINTFPKKIIKEFIFDDNKEYAIGENIKIDIFNKGDYLDIKGKTKGKGFQGVIKRYGLSRGPESHGSRYHRRPGSMGACADPSRVFKGKKLPGRTGNKYRTIQNIKLVDINTEKNLLLVKGAIPGPSNGIVFVKKAIKKIKQNKPLPIK